MNSCRFIRFLNASDILKRGKEIQPYIMEWTVLVRDEKNRIRIVVVPDATRATYAEGCDLDFYKGDHHVATFKGKDLVGYFQGRDANLDIKIERIED